jgi:hypothetical protein
MIPAEFAAALSDRLRLRGVDFQPADLEAFTTDVGQHLTETPDVDAWAERFIQSRRPSAQVSWGWKRFWRIFAVWFAVLMLFFVLANMAGLLSWDWVYRATGFPFPFAEGEFDGFHFYRVRLILNVLIAVAVSAVLAAACAAARCRGVPVR